MTKSTLAAARDILAVVEHSLNDDKAHDLRIIALAGRAEFADFMVIASGTSSRHVNAMTEHLLFKLKHGGCAGVRAEGRAQSEWVLVDAGDVVVHLFQPEIRAYYDLEKLWGAEPVHRAEQMSAAQ